MFNPCKYLGSSLAPTVSAESRQLFPLLFPLYDPSYGPLYGPHHGHLQNNLYGPYDESFAPSNPSNNPASFPFPIRSRPLGSPSLSSDNSFSNFDPKISETSQASTTSTSSSSVSTSTSTSTATLTKTEPAVTERNSSKSGNIIGTAI